MLWSKGLLLGEAPGGCGRRAVFDCDWTPCREFPYRLGARIVASLARPEGNPDRPPNGNFITG